MHSKLVYAAALVALVGVSAASAADLPVYTKAPPVPVVTYNWTGCYVGVNGGWKDGRFHDQSADVAPITGPVGTAGTFTAPRDFIGLNGIDRDSGAVGGQIGCRWQTPQNWVFGVEGDADWTNLRGTVVNPAPGTVGGLTFIPGDTFESRMRAEGSVRAIVGRAWDRLLVYGT